MANKSIKHRILSISPHVEMLVRKMYWDNIGYFTRSSKKKGKRKKRKKGPKPPPIDINDVLEEISRNGVGAGSLLVVHSSYGELKKTGCNPGDLIARLRELIGPQGTLAMPAIRKYPEAPSPAELFTKDMSAVEPAYNVKTSKVWTGLLPSTLLSVPGAVASRHPLNSMVAVGPLAEAMMAKNLDGEKPLPHGVNSSWNFCVENNAIVLGLGIDLTHSLTMIHVAEDILDDNWPVEDWYRDRPFKIVDGDFNTSVVVRERKPMWGTYKFAERTLCKDLIRAGILSSTDVNGITVEAVQSTELIEFLASKNQSGYPYYWVKTKS